MGTAFDVIGLIGSFVISAGLVPQVSKVFRTKSADDISYSFLFMYNLGLALVVIYGIGESLWPIYIPCALELLGAIALLVMKVLYTDRSKDMETGFAGKINHAPQTPTGRYFPALTPK